MSWEPQWCIRPGAILEEEMQERGWDSWRVCSWADLTPKQLLDFIYGGPLSPALAQALAKLPDSPSATFWLAMENNYRAALAAGKPDMA